MGKNILGGSHGGIAPDSGISLGSLPGTFFKSGSMKKNYACVERLVRIWNEHSSHYASLKEFLADIQG